MKTNYSFKFTYQHKYVIEPLPLSEHAKLDYLDKKVEELNTFNEANIVIQKIKGTL